MSEFLSFAWELLSKVVYNIVAVFAALLNLLVFGWVDYFNIFLSYFNTFNVLGKIGAVILFALLAAIPVLIVIILVRRWKVHRELKHDSSDNKTLYREIGRLNKQVLDLMEEKNKLLAIKVNAMGGTQRIPYMGASALTDDAIPTVANVLGKGSSAGGEGEGVPGVVAGSASLSLDGDSVSDAAAAMAKATVEAKTLAEEKEISLANRFPKLSLVDLKYRDWQPPVYDDAITLEHFVEGYREFACSELGLYYSPEIVRRYVAGMAASKLLILEGISGTGKTSLPYSFSRYVDNPATIVSVQPSFRDRTEVLGYFNEFSKRFNETEFLRALYEAGLREDPSFIVLDEMNLARVEYYFAEILSVLEMPSHDEWVLELVPTAWDGDPKAVRGHRQQRRLHVHHHRQGVRPRHPHRAQRARRRVRVPAPRARARHQRAFAVPVPEGEGGARHLRGRAGEDAQAGPVPADALPPGVRQPHHQADVRLHPRVRGVRRHRAGRHGLHHRAQGAEEVRVHERQLRAR